MNAEWPLRPGRIKRFDILVLLQFLFGTKMGYNYITLLVVALITIQNTVWGCTELTAYSSSESTIYSHSSYNGYTDYSDSYYACWKIKASSSFRIVQLSANTFDVELQSSCSYDVLRIYDGSSTSGTNYLKKCGSSVWTTIHSSGRYMYLEFQTDSSTTANGFSLSYSQVSSYNYDSSVWSGAYYSEVTSSAALAIGAIVGIVIGCLILLGIVAFVVIVIVINTTKTKGRVMQGGPRNTNTTIVASQQQMGMARPAVHPIQTYGRPAGVIAPPGYGQQGQPQPFGQAQPFAQPTYGQPPPQYAQAVQQPSRPPMAQSVSLNAGGQTYTAGQQMPASNTTVNPSADFNGVPPPPAYVAPPAAYPPAN